MAKKEFDRRYAADRQAMKTKQTLYGDSAPRLYRADLFHAAKRDRPGLGFREIARYVGISTTSAIQAFDGQAVKLDVIYKLAKFFGIPWIALFDVDRHLTIERRKSDSGGLRMYENEYFISAVARGMEQKVRRSQRSGIAPGGRPLVKTKGK